jgi:hypothetical protein
MRHERSFDPSMTIVPREEALPGSVVQIEVLE